MCWLSLPCSYFHTPPKRKPTTKPAASAENLLRASGCFVCGLHRRRSPRTGARRCGPADFISWRTRTWGARHRASSTPRTPCVLSPLALCSEAVVPKLTSVLWIGTGGVRGGGAGLARADAHAPQLRGPARGAAQPSAAADEVDDVPVPGGAWPMHPRSPSQSRAHITQLPTEVTDARVVPRLLLTGSVGTAVQCVFHKCEDDEVAHCAPPRPAM